MKNSLPVLAFVVSLLPGGVVAEIKELSQAELRASVAERDTISTRRLIAGVENYSGGRVVDIRAFDVDETVTYRIMVRYETGQIGTLLVDGQTGKAVAADSAVGKQLEALSAWSEERPQVLGNGNAQGNANARGNANRRSNGSDRGNSSGRGNSGGRNN